MILHFLQLQIPTQVRFMASLNGWISISMLINQNARLLMFKKCLPFRRRCICIWRAGWFPSSWPSYAKMHHIWYRIYRWFRLSWFSWPLKIETIFLIFNRFFLSHINNHSQSISDGQQSHRPRYDTNNCVVDESLSNLFRLKLSRAETLARKTARRQRTSTVRDGTCEACGAI